MMISVCFLCWFIMNKPQPNFYSRETCTRLKGAPCFVTHYSGARLFNVLNHFGKAVVDAASCYLSTKIRLFFGFTIEDNRAY